MWYDKLCTVSRSFRRVSQLSSSLPNLVERLRVCPQLTEFRSHPARAICGVRRAPINPVRFRRGSKYNTTLSLPQILCSWQHLATTRILSVSFITFQFQLSNNLIELFILLCSPRLTQLQTPAGLNRIGFP